MRKIYRGTLGHYDNGEDDEILGVADARGDVQEPLAECIKDDIEAYGPYLSVRYFIADQPMSREALTDAWVKTVCGLGEADYAMRYSEITGYLWTDEAIRVGGHDLLEELQGHLGQWLDLEIDYQQAPRVVR